MKKYILYYFLAAVFQLAGLSLAFADLSFSELPVLYQGRFRPLETYSRLWLNDFYQASDIQKNDREAFQLRPNESVQTWIWQLHRQGFHAFNQAPLFAISSAELKNLLGLPLKQNRFSGQELKQALYEIPSSSRSVFRLLITYYAAQAYQQDAALNRKRSWELQSLAPGLWVHLKGESLRLMAMPSSTPWTFFQSGEEVAALADLNNREWFHQHKNLADKCLALIRHLRQFEQLSGDQSSLEVELQETYQKLKAQQVPPQEIHAILERQFPLKQRLAAAGSLLKMLPGRYQPGEWFSLHALKIQVHHPVEDRLVPISNFTLFPDIDFHAIRRAYLKWEQAGLSQQTEAGQQFTIALSQAYEKIAGQPYQEGHGKALTYPSLWQLKLEKRFYSYPLIELALGFYGLSLLSFLAARRHPFLSISFFICALSLQTIILICRSLIVERPPVSNMFETLIYVPWIASLTSLIFFIRSRYSSILAFASLLSLILFLILHFTHLNSSLEPVQAVLDSQFWLMTHVLMVVGSYGVFLLGGIIGHGYLIAYLYRRQEERAFAWMPSLILQTFYVGTTLLISGTILGGVWAAESWGRFWDWDPKESWAFISSCIYLMGIHAYRFHFIGSFGLAISSVVGILTISFTWYGVNYILGTGLHSYGFGSGGEIYYLSFFIGELGFILFSSLWRSNIYFKIKN